MDEKREKNLIHQQLNNNQHKVTTTTQPRLSLAQNDSIPGFTTWMKNFIVTLHMDEKRENLIHQQPNN
jgi:hypothetical protein